MCYCDNVGNKLGLTQDVISLHELLISNQLEFLCDLYEFSVVCVVNCHSYIHVVYMFSHAIDLMCVSFVCANIPF